MTQPDTESHPLLAEQGWLRRLAHSLIHDSALAEDALQETLLRAVTTPPRAAIGSQASRRWLSMTLRGRVKNAARSARRRRDHEALVKEDSLECATSTAELVAKAEVSKKLVRHVIELGEPHRSVLLLRFFEGRSTEAMAEELGVSRDAVRARLVRAQQRLRDALDESSGGDRSVWVSSLLPLAGASAPTSLSTKALAATLMSVKTLTLAGAILAALFLSWTTWFAAGSANGTMQIQGSAPTETVDVGSELAVIAGADATSRIAQSLDVTPAPPPGPKAELFLEGRVLGPDGQGMEGAVVEVHQVDQFILRAGGRPIDDMSRGLTKKDGTFRLPVSTKTWAAVLVAYSEGYAREYREYYYFDERPGESASDAPRVELGDVQLEAERVVEGVVMDLKGEPIAGARIRAQGEFGEDGGGGLPAAYPELRPALALSGPDGSFRVVGLPHTATHIIALHEDFLAGHEAIPRESNASGLAAPVAVRLRSAVHATGRVHFPAGFPSEPVSLFVAPSQSRLRPVDGSSIRHRVSSDGSFVIPSLIPGAAYDIGLWTKFWSQEDTDPRSLMQTFVAGESEPLVIDYLEGAVVTFKVTDQRGVPIESARVRVWSSTTQRGRVRDSYYDQEEPTEWPDGVVTVEGLVPEAAGGHLKVTVSAKGFAQVELPPIDIDSSARVDAGVVQLTPLGALPSKKGLEGPTFTVIVDVEATDAELTGPLEVAHRWRAPGKGFPGRKKSLSVGVDGTLEMSGLRPGNHFFRVTPWSQGLEDQRVTWPSWESNQVLPWTKVEVSPDSPAIMRVTIKTEPFVQVHGRVTQAGAPLKNGKLFLVPGGFRPRDFVGEGHGSKGCDPSSHGALSPTTGEFTVDRLPPGKWTALVRAPGAPFLHAELFDISGDSASLQIDLPRATVKGRVVDADGQPVPSALLRLAPADKAWASEYQEIMKHLRVYGLASVHEYGVESEYGRKYLYSGRDGRFAIPYVPTGVDWRFWAHGLGKAAGLGRPFRLSGSDEIDLGDIVLEPEAVLSIRANSEHIGGTYSIVRKAEDGQEPELVSVECRGPITRLKRLPEGSYSVIYERSGESGEEVTRLKRVVTLKRGESVEVVF